MSDLGSYQASTDARISALQAENDRLRDQLSQVLSRLDALEGGNSRRPSTAGVSTVKKPVGVAPRPATAAAKPALSRPASAKPASSPAGAKKPPPNVGKKPAPDTTMKVEIDESRVGSYMVGKRKVYYVVPSDYKQESGSEHPPSANLAIDWIYGYNGKAARNNLFFLDKTSSGSGLVYPIAATGVVFNHGAHTQQFFNGHNEDILALAYSPARNLAASGQIDPKGKGKPYVCVWNTNTMSEVTRLDGFHDRGIAAIGFSSDGKRVVSVGMDDSHTAAVWDYETDSKSPIAQNMVAKDDVYGLTVNPYNSTLEFVAYGSKLLKVFSLIPNESASSKNPWTLKSQILSTFKETKVTQKGFHSATYLSNGDLCVGTETGQVYVFRQNNFYKNVDAHKSTVGALVELPNGGFASGGHDNTIKIFNGDYECTATIEIPKAKIRSLDYNSADDTLAVGTTGNQIYLVSVGAKSSRLAMDGHGGEIWGCSVHPIQNNVFVTCGHDKILRAWDSNTKSPVPGKAVTLKNKLGACAFSPEGKWLAVGQHGGVVALIDYDSFEVKYEKQHRKEQIDAIAFSPNGQVVGLGSWDQMVEIIDVESKTSITIKGHTSSITHLTFSSDSKYLQTNSRDYEILYWEVETGKRVDKSVTADVIWYDWTALLGWPVKGIFGKGQDGTDVNAVNINHTNTLVVTGNDTGEVTLYRYPSNPKGMKQFVGHSAFVTNVRFSRDDRYIFSTGGNDLAIIQWRLQK